jgi:hypothetical protein
MVQWVKVACHESLATRVQTSKSLKVKGENSTKLSSEFHVHTVYTHTHTHHGGGGGGRRRERGERGTRHEQEQEKKIIKTWLTFHLTNSIP